ncbi:KH domain-containing protein [Microaceticoccus formicicus]|uniref:KH domain-containing protein n=1 Tax=Microaceticoccus formicicus TaxID=3118105 RepID=UPI003CD0417B|nr:KH domain-containing protein [Peptoniphilaceae bacterium AMB_02]
MKDLILNIAKQLVDNPENVIVDESREGNILTIRINVDPSDMGKIIGKQGRIAKAIRTVAKAAGTKENLQVNIDIVD